MQSDSLTDGTSGNISILNAKENLIAISPSAISYNDLRPEDIPVVHNYGEWVKSYDATGNPHEACEALVAAAY